MTQKSTGNWDTLEWFGHVSLYHWFSVCSSINDSLNSMMSKAFIPLKIFWSTLSLLCYYDRKFSLFCLFPNVYWIKFPYAVMMALKCNILKLYQFVQVNNSHQEFARNSLNTNCQPYFHGNWNSALWDIRSGSKCRSYIMVGSGNPYWHFLSLIHFLVT